MSLREWASRAVAGGGGAAGAVARTAMIPASWLFGAAAAGHHALYDRGLRPVERVPVPVFSVGNLRVGGSGKTPFAAWLVERLLERGRRPGLLHGGYADDEPALHRLWHPDVPVFVGRERAVSARRAAEAGCDALVLDDAFQHRRLHRDADIVLLAAEHAQEKPRPLPAGPWREPLRALGRADLLVITRKTADADAAAALGDRLGREHGVPWAAVHLRPGPLQALARPEGATGEVLAVAALADPEPFFRNLEGQGVRLAGVLRFPDHHVYSAADVVRIRAAAAGRPVATTAKDAVKLGALMRGDELLVLEQSVVVERGARELDSLLDRVLA